MWGTFRQNQLWHINLIQLDEHLFDDGDDGDDNGNDGEHELPHFQVMKLVRMRQRGLDEDFEGKTYSRVRNKAIKNNKMKKKPKKNKKITFFSDTGKCDAEHERSGAAEHDLPPREARGRDGGSQASLEQLLIANH